MASGAAASDGTAGSLWFDPPVEDQDRRRQLTRERVVTEALAVIAHDGVQALTMRRLAARLGVVPGALYRHVNNKQQLQDLVLDNVLAEVDLRLDPAMDWTNQLKVLARRLRQVLALTAPGPFPRPGRPGRARLGRQPRPAVHRRPAGAGRWAGADAQARSPTVPVPIGGAHTLRHGRGRRELALRRSRSGAGPSRGGVRRRPRRRAADAVRRRGGRGRQDPARHPVRRAGPGRRRAGAAGRLHRAGRDVAAVCARGPGAARAGPGAEAGRPGRAGRAGAAAAGPPAARARPGRGTGLGRARRRLVGAGPAVRGGPRPAGAPRRPVPDHAGGGGPALGRPLHPGPAHLPSPQPPGRAAAGADLPVRRAAPPPPAAAVPGRAGPQRPGRPARGGPLRPCRRRRPAGRHRRDETGRRADRADLPPLGGQRVLRRGAARRRPPGRRQRTQPAPEPPERAAEPGPGPPRRGPGDPADRGRGQRPGGARAAGRGPATCPRRSCCPRCGPPSPTRCSCPTPPPRPTPSATR
jgi:AcrR family transcriptional regulator